ncbi:hypothetical protein [Haliangium sp.]|uniref:hypothetical protein n=1 Tax=Haliangium sp. TaxID=2663208 RepID=UPI003D0C2A81
MATKKKAKKKKTTKTTRKPAKKEREVLLVGSKVKAVVKEHDCNFGGDAIQGLNEYVHWLLTQATQRAKSNGRKTVRAHDFLVM